MASACVNNSPAPLSSYRFFNPKPDPLTDPNKSDPGPATLPAKDLIDFEFRLHDDNPVAMLTADELFSDGKLRPLQAPQDPIRTSSSAAAVVADLASASASSPKAPKCSSRWREILGLKKKQQQPDPSSRNPNPKSIKNLLHRNPRSSAEPSLSLPLLRDSDSDSISLSSSRLSLSSTSSSSDSCDLPRLSLDADKPSRSGSGVTRTGPNRIRTRPLRRTAGAAADAESPRMNSSGKVVFYSGSLERSSSSPGSFNGGGGGGARVRARGMERSYSANVVRVTPVLNVPVCSLRRSGNSGSVFGFFSGSGSKKEKNGGNSKVRS